MADHGHHAHHFDSAEAVVRLEAEGEVARGLEAEAIERCAAAAGGRVERVLDLGCGPGLGTVALARAFPAAEVLAVDGSRAMLDRARARAITEGLATRVEVRALDLDGDLASLGACDVAWASMALHHARDPSRALAGMAALPRPGGVLCLLEHADRPLELAPPGLRVVDDRTLTAGRLSRRLVLAVRAG